ncbi:MAG: hypothetical protein FWG98_01175, partial [Candidatus Cloacimonetes bacterium]|nr:hypothetical protein [Candidatus Cloacimonadota bacterium]
MPKPLLTGKFVVYLFYRFYKESASTCSRIEDLDFVSPPYPPPPNMGGEPPPPFGGGGGGGWGDLTNTRQ